MTLQWSSIPYVLTEAHGATEMAGDAGTPVLLTVFLVLMLIGGIGALIAHHVKPI